MSFTQTWYTLLRDTILYGNNVAPRGKPTKERLHPTIKVDMRYPVLLSPKRKLSYQFMAAEAYWILSGDNTVAGIAPFNSRISEFSDDGKTFFGAYGPPIKEQLDYVVSKLESDETSRQAGLTIWQANPPETKDVPCTVSIFFSIRGDVLNAHVFMRSSDLWLGLPYDVFNFSMLGHLVCCHLNSGRKSLVKNRDLEPLQPGWLYLTAVSSHLYLENYQAAVEVLYEPRPDVIIENATSPILYQSSTRLMNTLEKLRHTRRGDELRWWETKP